MKIYVFNAALLCDECGNVAKLRCDAAGKPNTGDTNDYPQGPYDNGGGESDSPQHCDHCSDFLENPLTEDGAAYVRERIEDGAPLGVARTIWAPFYGLAPEAGNGG